MDLVDSEISASTEALIHRVNPAAPVHKTIKCNVDLKLIIDISAFRSPPQIQHSDITDHHAHNHSATPNHYELRGISSLQVPCPPLDQLRLEKLDAWIRTVLWENRIPDSDVEVQVLRCKGLLATDSQEYYVLQGVRSMYEIEKLEEKEDVSVPPESKLVFIGKGLDDRLRQSLEDALL